jgi:hypothetical protein
MGLILVSIPTGIPFDDPWVPALVTRPSLAQSDVGERLASLQALSSTYQEGNREGFISSRRFVGRGRPTA